MKKLFTTCIALLIVSSTVISQPWFNKISDEAGLAEVKGFRVWLADVNGDDYPDLIWGGDVGALYNNIYLMMNVPNPDQNSSIKRIFKDATAESGLQKSRIDTNISRTVDIAAFADLDNDGDLDIVTSIYGHRVQNYVSTGDRSEVMLNDGNGHFTLVNNHGLDNFNYASSLALGQTSTTGLSFLDYDLDGNIDLYVGTWFAHYGEGADVYMGNFLFKGNGDGTFQKGVQVGAAEPLYGTNVTDWNNDGWPDIVNSPYCRTSGQFFKNVNGMMIEASAEAGYNAQRLGGDHAQPLCQWEANPADFDNDGDMDLLEVKVHGGYNPGEGRTTISVNSGQDNGFKYDWELDRIRRAAPIESHLGDQGGTWFDFDNDGWQDIALGQNSYPQANIYGQERLYLLHQNSDGTFDEILPSVTKLDTLTEAHSMEPADFDMDGDQDLFLSRIVRETIIEGGVPKAITYNRIELVENKKAEENNFIQIKLAKDNNIKGANASYIGAKVFVHTCDFTQKQEIQSGLGHFAGMQPFIKTFGLGQITSIDSVVVIYPNKAQSRVVIYGPPVNTLLEIVGGVKFVDMNNKFPKKITTKGVGTLDFGSVNVGETSTKNQVLVNVSNTSDSPLTISDITLTGSNAFTVDKSMLPITICCKDTTINIPVTFTPEVRTEYHAKLKFTNNSDNAPAFETCIKGFGFEPKAIMALNKREINFDSIWVDSVTTESFQISNMGEVPLDITAINLSGDTDVFNILSPTNFTIAPNEMIEVVLQFAPKSKNNYNDLITVISNAFNKDTVSVIQINGVCNGPNSEISTDAKFTIAFGDVMLNDTKEKTLTISNDGDGELIINSVVIDPVGTYSHNIEEFPLRITDKKEVILTFTPKSAQSHFADLIISSDAVNSAKYVKRMTGSGVTTSSVDMWENGNRTFHFKIAPNPLKNNGQLIVESLDASNAGKLSAEMYDATGKMVLDLFGSTIINSNTTFDLNVSQLISGTYYIKILSENEAMVTLPTIIEK